MGSSKSTKSVANLHLLTDPKMLIVALVSFIGVFGNNAVAPVLPVLANEFGVSDARIGLIISLLTLPSLVFAPLSGILADMYGRRRVIVLALSIFGLAGGAIAFVTDFKMVLSLRLVQGIGFAALMALTITLLGDYYTGPEGSAAQGFRGSANGIGNIVVPALVGFLAEFAWQYPFLLFGLAVPIAVLVYYYLPETVDQSSDDTLSTEDLSEYIQDLRAEITDPNLSVLMFGGVPRFLVMYAILTFVPLYAVRVLGATPFEAGVVLGMRGFARVIIPPLSGSLLAVLSRKQSLILGLGVSTVATVMIPLVHSVVLVALAVGIYGIGDGIFSPVLKDTVTHIPADEHRAGVVSSMQIVKDLSKTTSPVLFGLLLTVSSFQTLFFVAAIVFIAYIVVLAVILKSGL